MFSCLPFHFIKSPHFNPFWLGSKHSMSPARVGKEQRDNDVSNLPFRAGTSDLLFLLLLFVERSSLFRVGLLERGVEEAVSLRHRVFNAVIELQFT